MNGQRPKLTWDACIKAGVTVFLLYLCTLYWPLVGHLLSLMLGAASPLLIGCVVAYLVNILMVLYERHYFPRSAKPLAAKSRRPVCMVAAMVTLAAVVVLVVALVLPELVSCVGVIIASLARFIPDALALLDKLEVIPDDLIASLSSVDWQSKLDSIVTTVLTGVGGVVHVVIGTVTSVFSGVVTGFMSFIFAVYLLLGKEKLAGQFDRVMAHFLRPSWNGKVHYVLAVLNDCFHRYIVGQCTEAVILGCLCAVGMALFRIPYATMIGALIAVTALIPVAGAYIGGVVGFLMVLSVSPMKAVFFAVYLVILQQLEGNLIYPRVVGSSLGLPAIWVLAAVTIGGGVLGVAGMLLGVPIAAALYRLLREQVNKSAVPPAPTEE